VNRPIRRGDHRKQRRRSHLPRDRQSAGPGKRAE